MSQFYSKSSAPSQKKIPFSFRLSPQEHALLSQRAGCQSMGAYVRKKVLDGDTTKRKVSRKPSIDHAAIASALSALGQSGLADNMNTIAAAAHNGALPVTPELSQSLHDACADVRAMREALITALGLKPKT